MVKKNLVAVCVGVMFLAGVTGCTKTAESSRQTQEDNDKVLSQQEQEDSGKELDGAISQENQNNETDNNAAEKNAEAENPEEPVEKPEDTPAPNEIISRDGTEFLSGKIQSVEEDGMIIAQTTILEDGMVTLVDEKDAKKISVKFTDDTKVEYWTIKGGGADIDRKDADLSDLEIGMGVEMKGDYEGETFVASQILIEEYV